MNCVGSFSGGDQPYLMTGSDDQTAKVWDYQTQICAQTLGRSQNISAVAFHPDLPIILTGSEYGTVRIWHSTKYRLGNIIQYGLERVWALGYNKGSNSLVRCIVVCGDGHYIIHTALAWRNRSFDSTLGFVLSNDGLRCKS
uniref:Coatomer WD associated region domain-containing protein n=1 Tax=Physcomitrium patens TaxID=3218 RepID=A0A7I4E6G3_PHYPA